jgi:heme-degrading monooxygenase HmoA
MFLAVFRNRKRADIDLAAYGAEAELMEDMARRQRGFISFKSYVADDGEVIALSEWENEDAALAWRKVAEHSVAQSRGRAEFYEDYTLFACKHPRVHRFSRKEGP